MELTILPTLPGPGENSPNASEPGNLSEMLSQTSLKAPPPQKKWDTLILKEVATSLSLRGREQKLRLAGYPLPTPHFPSNASASGSFFHR